MTTIPLHVASSWIPIAILIPAIGLLIASFWKPDSSYRKISFWLFILSFVSVFFTCGMGGASIRLAESIPDTNISKLKVHAWTSMGAFLSSLAWSFLFFYNNKRKKPRIDIIILIISFAFLVLYAWTIFEATGIR